MPEKTSRYWADEIMAIIHLARMDGHMVSLTCNDEYCDDVTLDIGGQPSSELVEIRL